MVPDLTRLGVEPSRALALADTPRDAAAAVVAALRREEAEGGPLAECELRPLACLPGWYAHRPPDEQSPGAVTEILLAMHASVVEARLGYAPARSIEVRPVERIDLGRCPELLVLPCASEVTEHGR